MNHHVPLEIPVDETALQKTVAASKAAFLASEGEKTVSSAEFLYQQSRYIGKTWWMLQGLLLLVVCLLLHQFETDFQIRRSLGVAAPLFVILILPELWKNRGNNAMEVEGTTFYTLRQIYAARLALFAGMDLLLLTCFFLGASAFGQVTVWELLIQFVLPFNVACCICLHCLYGGRNGSEAFSILLCSVWSGLWVLVISSDALYDTIAVPVWAGLLMLSFGWLGYCIRRGQKRIYKIWEAKPSWN